ncbi:MAG TPA: PDZ domain-containing protein [Candidatus Syntrophosphaera thermopropionivorans]|nr:PDZ domain-containing protein [Candidatus Syntrophosphaera thermopropionivorans]
MKIRLVSLVIISVLFSVLTAENPQNINLEMKMIGLSDVPSEEEVYFGVYIQDLDFPTAQSLGYNELYGILVTKVEKGSLAWQAGIKNNDILMKLNGYPIFNVKEFRSIKKLLRPGDTVWLTIWREGKIFDITTKLQGRTKGKKPGKSESNEKVGYPVGWGGGSWMPYWAVFPVDDVNELITNIGESTEDKGFAHKAINEDGVFMSGGGGKVNIGKGFFLGGVGAGYSFSDSDASTHSKIKYNLSFGGVTLDKRYAINTKFIGSLGIMLGSGGHEVEYSALANTDFNWPEISSGGSFNVKVSRNYFMVQPRAEMLIRLLPWLGIQTEVGYMCGIPTHSGWKVQAATGDVYSIDNSPDTPFHSLTISVGPWFGF